MSIGGDWPSKPTGVATMNGVLADIPDPAGYDGWIFQATDQVATYLSVAGAWVRISTPVGHIGMTGLATASPGHVLLQGQAVSRTGIYAALFALWGTLYGAGNGTTTFNVMDMGGRVAAGWKSGDANFGTLGAAVGAATVALVTAELPAHLHVVTGSPSLTGSPSVSGTPSLSGAPALTGAPSLSGSPSLSGAPSLSGSPGVSDPGHGHGSSTTTAYDAGGSISQGTGAGHACVGGYGSVSISSSTTGISVNNGSLAVGNGSLAVGNGSLAVTAGSLAVGNGTLAVGVGSLTGGMGSLVAAAGTLATANTGSGTAHANLQPSRTVNFEAKL